MNVYQEESGRVPLTCSTDLVGLSHRQSVYTSVLAVPTRIALADAELVLGPTMPTIQRVNRWVCWRWSVVPCPDRSCSDTNTMSRFRRPSVELHQSATAYSWSGLGRR